MTIIVTILIAARQVGGAGKTAKTSKTSKTAETAETAEGAEGAEGATGGRQSAIKAKSTRRQRNRAASNPGGLAHQNAANAATPNPASTSSTSR